MSTTESIQIHLNSKNATSYNQGSYSDCNFSLPMLEFDDQSYIHLSVQSCVIPYSFYNIDAYNNVLYYQEILVDTNNNQIGTINTVLNITYGNYNAIQLATYLQTNLPRTIVSYSTINGKYTFTNSTNNFIIKNGFSTCLGLIGLSSNDLYNTSILMSLTSYSPANLSPRQCICVSSNLQTGNINNQLGSNKSIICSIPVISQPFSLITYNNINQSKFNLYTNFINTITLKLTDQNNQLINLNNQFFSITLQIDVIKFVDEN